MSETPGNLTAALDEIRERAKGPMRSFRDVDDSQADVPRLLKALGEVLKLHAPIPDDQDWCCECGHSFPCWTQRAISRALRGEESNG